MKLGIFSEAGKEFIQLRKQLITNPNQLESLIDYQDKFKSWISSVLSYSDQMIHQKLAPLEEIEAVLYLCLDFYCFSETGEELVPDTLYNPLMELWIGLGNERIIYPDPIRKQWSFKKHEEPGMVGSLSKIYTEKELAQWYSRWSLYGKFTIAPKFDGTSCCIKIKNNTIVSGLTRYDGYNGQDITSVVRGVSNANTFMFDLLGEKRKSYDGYYKVEIVMTTQNFEKLMEVANYKNRRSAVSGIVNTPKNLEYARYLTIIPLLFCTGYDESSNTEFVYNPPKSKRIRISCMVDLYEEVSKMIQKCCSADFPVRTDGAVIVPEGTFENYKLNRYDYLQESIAYKINNEFGFSKILYGYMSIGRTGLATPMIKVKPVEVNETVVQDVSLGSYDKYAGMQLREGEVVKIYSAGNVIPQAEIPDIREYPAGADYLEIPKRCSYCGSKLERVGNEYYCRNLDCIRVVTGRITSFLDKMGCQNISDNTVEDLYKEGIVRSIEDLFSMDRDRIANMPSYGEVSATNIVNEIHKMCTKPVQLSTVLGSIGIPNISEKKCKRILEYVDLNYLLKKKSDKIAWKILEAEGVGYKTANIFADFIVENRELLEFLIKHLNIMNEVHYAHNVVFTGFRDPKLIEKFHSIGYDVVHSVTGKTVAVIANITNIKDSDKSTNYRQAEERGIMIVPRMDVDRLLEQLENGYEI